MIGNAFLLAIREIRNNLMRAALTTLGIVIGVGAVIAMVTLGEGATQSVTAGIASMGRNLLIVSPGQRRPGQMTAATSFQIADSDAIKREITGLAAVAPAVTRSAVVVYGNRNRTTQVTGTSNDFFTARDWAVSLGRPFNAAEDRSGRAVCVLGETVRKDMFGAQDPLGERVRVGNVSCDVVGVLAAKGQSTFGSDQDDTIIMPLRAVQRRIAGNTDVSMIWVSTQNAGATARAKNDVAALLRERRRIAPGAPDDFQVNDMQEVARTIQSTTAILTAFLSSIAAVSLLVGGIGIMNVMLVSVTERTREIGIRLAIGAREHDVLLQFLIEAIVISALGGVIGIAIGLAGSSAASAVLGFPFVFRPEIAVIAVVFSAGVGVAFGYFPARRAARLDPIEALRHE
jgi:putative ABC transport system permease protein